MAKRARSQGSDTISNLPTNIRNNILSKLPLRDAVRATILSRRWRHCWINLPNLVFADTMLKVSLNDDKIFAAQKYVSTINQILLLHKGPILKFSLSYSLLENGPEIDHIISFLSTSRVEELNLRFVRDSYKLPSSFYSCRELRHLDFIRCTFSCPPEFVGFPKLISLKFAYVALNDFSGNFISECPLLERLTLSHVHGSHSCKISAPKLEYLCFEESSLPLSFKRVPRLQSASVQPSTKHHGGEGSLVDLFDCIPPLNKLVMNQTFIELLAENGVPKKVPTLTNLKILQLNEISCYDEDELSSLYSLISSFPHMERIEIEMDPPLYNHSPPITDFLKARDYAAEIFLDELLEVCLTHFTGTGPELELIKLILAKSPVLEKILIKVPRRTNADTRLIFLKELVRFKRASPAAEIIYE